MSKKLRIFLIPTFLVFGFFFLVLLVLLSLLKPLSNGSQSMVNFVIPKGQAISVIGERLQEEKLIRSGLAFRVLVKFKGLEDNIQAGSFKLSSGMSLGEIAASLTQGTEDLWLTIPEGWRTEEIAENLAAQDDLELFDAQDFLAISLGSEGYLFPDTYLVPKQIDSRGLFDLLSNTFDKKVVQGLSSELSSSDKTLEQIVVMASIVEREARGYEQMRGVAGVLWNRIELGMPLQADATLQYIKAYDDVLDTWWPTPLAADKQIESPFNTYLNPGLPPKPICNPGLEAIQATLNPKNSDYLYYIHDRQGEVHFAKTLQEHNANVEKYLR